MLEAEPLCDCRDELDELEELELDELDELELDDALCCELEEEGLGGCCDCVCGRC